MTPETYLANRAHARGDVTTTAATLTAIFPRRADLRAWLAENDLRMVEEERVTKLASRRWISVTSTDEMPDVTP